MKLEAFKKKVLTDFTEPFDLKARDFLIAGKIPAVAFFIDTIAGGGRVALEIINPLSRLQDAKGKENLDFITKAISSTCFFEIKEKYEDIITELLNGKTIVIVEGHTKKYISCDTTVMPGRGVAEPPTNSVVMGPREGFTENLVVNIGLIRKRLKTPDLTLVNHKVGQYSQTNVSIMYIKSIADDDIVKNVEDHIKSINIDGILDSFYIMQYLQSEAFNIFRQVGSSEKPDVIASKLLEGRVIIIVDGSPIVLSVPYILLEDLQAADDYYNNNTIVSVRRFIRLLGAVFAITIPGLYISLQLYHYNILPLNTLFLVTNSIENTPFSPLLEVLIVLILFEIMYEASLRMPRHLGAATSLVAALVLGGAAVEAGLLSSPAVLVSALSMIMMYILPNLAPQISLLRFVFTIIAGILGLYGLIMAGILLVIYLASLDNFGTPLLAPFAPYCPTDSQDAIIMKNIRDRTKRPTSFPNKNKTRAKNPGGE
ncbi:MAG: spore germination protein [Firmicutes bacterium]|nr:spore germination protein [Bacillota bacterium]